MSYRAAAVEVRSVERAGAFFRLRLRLLEPERIRGPLAPATLVPLEGAWRAILEIHRASVRDEDDVTVESGPIDSCPLVPDQHVGYQRWWTSDQLELASDVSRVWAAAEFDPKMNGVNDHCRLGWESLYPGYDAPGTTELRHKPAFRSDDHWLCPTCYQKFILDDYLGIRGRSANRI